MIRKILNGGLFGLTSISAAFLGAAVILSAYNAITRAAFSFSSPWIEELCCYLASLTMFLMMPKLEYTDDQLSISFLDEKLKDSLMGRRIIFYIRGVVTVFLYYILLKAGYSVVSRNLEIKSASPVLHVPYGQMYAIVVAALVIVIVYWIFHFFLKEWREAANESC